jgi:hypothetical protein
LDNERFAQATADSVLSTKPSEADDVSVDAFEEIFAELGKMQAV